MQCFPVNILVRYDAQVCPTQSRLGSQRVPRATGVPLSPQWYMCDSSTQSSPFRPFGTPRFLQEVACAGYRTLLSALLNAGRFAWRKFETTNLRCKSYDLDRLTCGDCLRSYDDWVRVHGRCHHSGL